MECDQVRDQLGDHLLGSLPPEEDQTVRRHLRGCGSCRQDVAALGEGLGTFARAAHETAPPAAVRDRVLAALAEETREAAAGQRRPRLLRRDVMAWAAAVVLLAGSLAWGIGASVRASDLSHKVGRYNSFLSVLGGKDVRVGSLHGRGAQTIEGSVVVYDSVGGQSWVLVLAKAPADHGTAKVILSSSGGPKRISLRPVDFDSDGEGSTWLVTSVDLTGFDRCRLADGAGHTLATARITSE